MNILDGAEIYVVKLHTKEIGVESTSLLRYIYLACYKLLLS